LKSNAVIDWTRLRIVWPLPVPTTQPRNSENIKPVKATGTVGQTYPAAEIKHECTRDIAPYHCTIHSFRYIPILTLKETTTMADDDDYVIESTDAGASATIPMEAGQIKKGG
jgi:hypothetical protein